MVVNSNTIDRAQVTAADSAAALATEHPDAPALAFIVHSLVKQHDTQACEVNALRGTDLDLLERDRSIQLIGWP
jgi:hypothetical protein